MLLSIPITIGTSTQPAPNSFGGKPLVDTSLISKGEDPKETEIDNPVVELKTTGNFNVEAAIAALEKANFAEAVAVK